MTRSTRCTRGIAVLTLLVLLSGCQQEPSVLPETTVDVPDEIKDGSAVWKRQATLSAADKECLNRFFQQNRELIGSPEFEGTPKVFVASEDARRFYWLRASIDGVFWRAVEFSEQQFSTSDGTGNPFL